jgi:acyl dehydratase
VTDKLRDTAATSPFDPRAHEMLPHRTFAELRVGERFVLPSRTVTDADFAAFRQLSGDNHPIHYDVEYCRAHGHPGLLAHGLQVLCVTAAGAGTFPHVIGAALIGFLEQSSKFLKPVYSGDTLYPALTISALTPQRSTGIIAMGSSVHNQRGELVLSGEHKYLVRLEK